MRVYIPNVRWWSTSSRDTSIFRDTHFCTLAGISMVNTNKTGMLSSRLTKISRDDSHSFEEFFQWDRYSWDDGDYYMPPELLSIFGTPLFDQLSPIQIRELSRLEVIQILYLYAYTESVMCLYLARHLVKSDFGSDEHAFILREQIEEYRHQDMFLRWLEILGKDYKPMTRLARWWTWLEAMILPAKYFFLLQITIELISREIGRLTFSDKRVNALVRDLSLMHEREEARHISFSDSYLEDIFRNSWFITRTLWGICIALDIAFINHFYIYPWMYKKAWIENDAECYKVAQKNIKNSPLKNMMTGSALEFLKKHSWITWANAWIFQALTGITKEKIYGKNT